MDKIISYLIDSGGIFGLLLAISLVWIAFREKLIYTNMSSEKKDVDDKNININKLINTIEEIKERQSVALKHLESIEPMIKNFHIISTVDTTRILKELEEVEESVADIGIKTNDLHKWHDVKDSDGVRLWYVRKSLEESINKVEISVSKLHVNVSDVNKVIRNDLEERLQKVNDDRVSELKTLLETYNKTITDLALALEKIKFLLRPESKIGDQDGRKF